MRKSIENSEKVSILTKKINVSEEKISESTEKPDSKLTDLLYKSESDSNSRIRQWIIDSILSRRWY